MATVVLWQLANGAESPWCDSHVRPPPPCIVWCRRRSVADPQYVAVCGDPSRRGPIAIVEATMAMNWRSYALSNGAFMKTELAAAGRRAI